MSRTTFLQLQEWAEFYGWSFERCDGVWPYKGYQFWHPDVPGIEFQEDTLEESYKIMYSYREKLTPLD